MLRQPRSGGLGRDLAVRRAHQGAVGRGEADDEQPYGADRGHPRFAGSEGAVHRGAVLGQQIYHRRAGEGLGPWLAGPRLGKERQEAGAESGPVGDAAGPVPGASGAHPLGEGARGESIQQPVRPAGGRRVAEAKGRIKHFLPKTGKNETEFINCLQRFHDFFLKIQ